MFESIKSFFARFGGKLKEAEQKLETKYEEAKADLVAEEVKAEVKAAKSDGANTVVVEPTPVVAPVEVQIASDVVPKKKKAPAKKPATVIAPVKKAPAKKPAAKPAKRNVKK